MHSNSARLAMAAAGGALALVMATPAYAQTTIDINDDHVPTTAEDFEEQDCTDDEFANLADDQDGWHFQLGAGGDNFESLTLTFDTPDGEVIVEITSTSADAPSTGPGWSGYISEAGQSGMFSHAWLATEAGWELIAGEATVDEPGTQDFFNLSHTCPGVPVEPTPSPTPTPEPTPTATPEPTPTATAPPTTTTPAPTASPTKGPEMPKTGAPVAGMVAVGAGLLAGGAGLLAVRRRPDSADQ
jgi:LPXTG-motif cell wall-anchored protein